MKKLNTFKYITTFSALLFTSFAIAGGGGGTTPDLNTKGGLERAAENFLTSFAYLSIAKDIDLPIIDKDSGIEGNIGTAINIEDKLDSYDSLWHFIIVRNDKSELPQSDEISQQERKTFVNDYIMQKNREYIQKQQALKAATTANTATEI